MKNVRSLALLLTVTLILALSVTVSRAQEQPAGGDQPARTGRRGGGQGGQGGGQPGGADFRAQMEKRVQDALGATDDEWKVLQPRIEKVRTLQGQSRVAAGGRGGAGFPGAGGAGGPGGRRRGGNNADPAAGGAAAAPATQPDRPQSALAKAQQDLSDVIKNKDATPDQIKAKLDALRTTRDAAKKELAAAQKDLRDIVNLRQEATLVNFGLLD